MKIIELDPNKVKVSSRFREAEPTRVEEMAQSLVIYGQLQPILVDEAYNLIAGLHRLSAARLNGSSVYAVVRGTETALFKKEMELEENIRRKEMTWQERNHALAELHRIKTEENPNWALQQTALMAGTSKTEISQAAKIEEMARLFPEIKNAKNFNQAVKMAGVKAKQVSRAIAVARKEINFGEIEQKIQHGDSVEVIKTIPDESFHAVITDPPFGINYEDRTAGSAISGTSSYADDKESYERLLSMASDLYRVIKPDGWLVWFLGITWYERAKLTFRAAGFTVDEIPIIWDRSDGRTFTSRPDRWFGRAYDIALHCVKGNPRLVVPNRHNIIKVAPVSTADKELLVERPVDLYAELIERMTLRGETVADFFVGSGSCPAAAAMTGRDYFGVEMSAERRARALEKIRAHTPQL